MRTVSIADITLREFVPGKGSSLSFKEKLEIAKTLDNLQVNVIELPQIKDAKADTLVNKTIASDVEYSYVSATVGYTAESVDEAWESIKGAKKPALHVMVPVSSAQMEYICGKKVDAVIDMIGELVSKCSGYADFVEFSAVDATRAEFDHLVRAIKTAISSGAKKITICDTSGTIMPSEISSFLDQLYAAVPELKDVYVAMQLSDSLNLALACLTAAIQCGITEIKSTVADMGYPKLENVVKLISTKGSALGVESKVKTADINRSSKQLQWILQTNRSEGSPFDNGASVEVVDSPEIRLDLNDDISEVIAAVKSLGYELSEDDNFKVYESVRVVAAKKQYVVARDLEAIIASTALQVPSAYHIDTYMINSGNNITATACITLVKDGIKRQGLSAGDGPVDAAFLAIEQIVGHHYELDEFQIQAVTEGREALGSAMLKIRANGKLYSGSGTSTDVIGACIIAYVNALNKIVYEEA